MTGVPARLAALALSLAAALGATGAASADVTALVGGTLVDGYGGDPVPNSVVIVDGERIAAVGQVGSLEVPAGAQVISTEGMTVLPGLWDQQVRLARLGHADEARWNEVYAPIAERVVMPAAARQLLLAGVTSVRDVGSPLAAALSVRDRIGERRLPGPTVRVSGPALGRDASPRGLSQRLAVSGAKDARDKADRLVRAGVDYLLVADVDRLADDELAAIVGVGREHRLAVQAEVRTDAEIARALAAGVDGLIGLGNGVSATLPDDAVRELSARAARGSKVPWTGGVSALTNYESLRANAEPLDDVRWREGLPAVVAEDVRASLRNPSAILWYEMPSVRRPLVGPRLRAAREAGAQLLVGSDAGAPGHVPARATWQEIEALVVDGGLTPMEAIQAATYWAATAAGVQHELGTVSPGKYADLIAVRGDPLRHVDRLADVEVVLKRGFRHR